ncbi:MAG: hypothetical protein JXQ96_06140 [Cyclobacteriaceae bacterium]
MKMTYSCVFVLGICGLLGACVEPPPQEVLETKDMSHFLDIDSLINSNIIGQNGRKLRKHVGLSGSNEEQFFISDTTLLQNDLEIFKDLPLNAPTLKEQYTITKEGTDTNYLRITGAGPQWMKISRTLQFASISAIRGEHSESNLFFDSNKKYHLQFDGDQKISSYEFSGYQKILFMDSVFFKIAAKFEP